MFLRRIAAAILLILIVGALGPARASLPEPSSTAHDGALPARLDFRTSLPVGGASGFPNPPVVGPEITIWEQDDKLHPTAVAYNWCHREYMVVWFNIWDDGSSDVWGARISAQGENLGGFPISHGDDEASYSDVAYDSDPDRYLVVWRYDANGDGSNWDIHGRFIPFYGPDSNLTDFPIGSSPWKQSSPKVIYNENPDWPEFLVGWHDLMTTEPVSISGRRVYADDTGFPPGDAFPISDHAPYDVYNPDVAYNLARNEYLVTFTDSEDTYGCFVHGDGSVADVLHLNTISRGEAPVVIACDPEPGHYLVVWEGATTFGVRVIWGRLLHTDKILDAPFLVVPPSEDHEFSDPVVAAGSLGYLVACEHIDVSSATLRWAIHGRLVWSAAIYIPLVMRG